MQLKFIATIREVNNVRSSQPRTITAYHVFISSFDIRTSWSQGVVFSISAMHCLQVLSGSSLVFLISLTSKDKRCTMECTMNYFVYAFMGSEGGHVPKCALVN